MRTSAYLVVLVISVILGLVFLPLPNNSSYFKNKLVGAKEDSSSVHPGGDEEWRDFSLYHKCKPKWVHIPRNVSDIVELVKDAYQKEEKIRVVGAGYSRNALTLTNEHIVNLDLLNKILKIDRAKMEATVEAGIRIKDLNELLHKENLSLPILPSSSEHSLAGAISIGAHGSGVNYPSFSNLVTALKVVDGKGEIVEISLKNGNVELLPAFRLSLGTLGIIVEVTIRVSPARRIRREETVMRSDIMRDHYFTKVQNNAHTFFWWIPNTHIVRYFVMNPSDYIASPHPFYPLDDRSEVSRFIEDNLTTKLAIFFIRIFSQFPDTWEPLLYQAIKYMGHVGYHDRSDLALSFPAPDHCQEIEYSVGLKDSMVVFEKLKQLFAENRDLAMNGPVTIRTIEEDDVWLSPQYERTSTSFAFVVYHNFEKFEILSRKLDTFFNQFNGRPHWAKTHYKTYEQLQQLYPKLNQFKQIREQFDPKNVFVNDYVKLIFGL